MIFHMLCLFLMMMLVNSVISAPGMDATQDVSRAREDKPKPKSSGTLDSLGGGYLLRLDRNADTEKQTFRSLEMFVDYQDDIPQNMVLVVREDKQKPSSSGTLDSIGGGNLLKLVDSDLESEISKSLVSFLENQDGMLHNMVSLDREDKQKPSSSGTLDSIGGGNLMGVVDSDAETDTIRFSNSLHDNQNDIRRNMVLVAREDKRKPSSSGTLDPIGGGNLVRIVDPEAETEFFNSLASFTDNKEEVAREDKPTPKTASSGTLDPIGGGNLVRVTDSDGEERTSRSMESLVNNQEEAVREDKSSPKPASSGTLDPLGGGNLVRVTDSNGEERTSKSMESLVNNQGRQNMMRLAREDKSIQRSSHALDGAGSGHIAGVTDPYRGPMFRSLDHSHLVDSLDQGGDVLKMLDSISGTDLLNSLDSQGVMAVLSALRKAQSKRMLDPKRMLDSVSGWTFGESKRNFDEIDNVGFTSFAKRNPRNPYYSKQLALAKKNFDEIDRAGFETYNKRDFDEIDRAGFETFEKRDRKE